MTEIDLSKKGVPTITIKLSEGTGCVREIGAKKAEKLFGLLELVQNEPAKGALAVFELFEIDPDEKGLSMAHGIALYDAACKLLEQDLDFGGKKKPNGGSSVKSPSGSSTEDATPTTTE